MTLEAWIKPDTLPVVRPEPPIVNKPGRLPLRFNGPQLEFW